MANFGDDFSGDSIEGAALNDVLRFAGAAIALALDDLAREDDVFEIEDREVVIFKFVRSVGGDGVAERQDQLAKVGDGHLGHAQVYEGGGRRADFCGLTNERDFPTPSSPQCGGREQSAKMGSANPHQHAAGEVP